MDCPVCKCPNAPGATHCTMCYEVFSRSAADAHLRSLRREQLSVEKENGVRPEIPDLPTQTLSQSVDRLREAMPSVDWSLLWHQFLAFVKRYRQALLIGFAVWILFMGWAVLRSPSFRMKTTGLKMAYSFSDKDPVRYLSTFSSEFRSWSQRQNQLDTPLENFRINELGNLTLQKAPGETKKEWKLMPKAHEWMVARKESDSTLSRSLRIPLDHPTLRGGATVFSSDGRVVRRDYAANARMGRSLQFAIPEIPVRRLKSDAPWSQPISWVEQIGPWKIFWSGKITWKIKADGARRDGLLGMAGQAALQPQVWEGPTWASGAWKELRFTPVASSAELTFDRHRGRIALSSLRYGGRLSFPIDNLDRIPMELRVGRRVRGPGRVYIEIQNRIDLRKH